MPNNEEWLEYAKRRLKGRKIVDIRLLTDEEVEIMGWCGKNIVLILDNGTILFPSRDDEGNGVGTLFAQTKDGDDLTFPRLSC